MIELYRPFQPTITRVGLAHLGLTLKRAPVCNLLNGVVHSYLQISTDKPTPYPILPDGTQAVFMSANGSMLGGALTHASAVHILQPGEYFGIQFHPGALRYFFDLNLAEITDQFIDSRDIPCRVFAELHKPIYDSHCFGRRTQICEQWLLRYYKPRPVIPFDHALSAIYRSHGSIRVGSLANMVGWSTRHLNRMFKHHTGLNTKSFSQIIRVQQVCRRLHTKPNESLKTALDLGFFDQSHLIKDFNKYFLSNPSLFFEQIRSDLYNP